MSVSALGDVPLSGVRAGGAEEHAARSSSSYKPYRVPSQKNDAVYRNNARTLRAEEARRSVAQQGGRADAFRNLRQNFDAAKYDRGEFLRKGSDLSDSLQQSIDAGARRYGPRKRRVNATRLFNWFNGEAFITEFERLKRELEAIM